MGAQNRLLSIDSVRRDKHAPFSRFSRPANRLIRKPAFQIKVGVDKKGATNMGRFWLRVAGPGVLLSAAAMFLGYELGSETAGLSGGEPGIKARLGKGFVWGTVIADLQ